MRSAATTCPRCGAALTGPACARCLLGEPGAEASRLGHLELGELLGKGGMGEVYRATDLRLGREVAVKFLPEALAATAEGRARFEREARALARLNHPHIVTLHEFGELEGQPYLVMELVEGAALPTRLPLPRAEALRIALAVCEALEFAHHKGVVHRDLKPANVLVDAQGRVKVADFGIARLLDAGPGGAITRGNVVAGTPQYLAPEALLGAEPSAAMDVFSMGVLVYELLTGRLPVGELAGLDPPLERVVKRAMAYSPQARHPSMRALADELSQAAQSAPEAGLPAEEQLWIRAVALVQAVAASLVFFAGVSMLTPKVGSPGELLPLMFISPEALPDGRIVTRARFEVLPALLATLGLGAALAAYGLLRRHWRLNGLARPQPAAPVPGAWKVAAAGGLAVALYGARRWLESSGRVDTTPYIPVLGGIFELAVVYLAFTVLLEADRRARPLWREPLLWGGCLLAVIPPVLEFVGHLQRWTP